MKYFCDITLYSLIGWQNDLSYYSEGKGKAIPLQAWTGLEGSRRLRPPDFKTVGT